MNETLKVVLIWIGLIAFVMIYLRIKNRWNND